MSVDSRRTASRLPWMIRRTRRIRLPKETPLKKVALALLVTLALTTPAHAGCGAGGCGFGKGLFGRIFRGNRQAVSYQSVQYTATTYTAPVPPPVEPSPPPPTARLNPATPRNEFPVRIYDRWVSP